MEQPSILVRILHSIPHVNYTFRRVNDTFNPDSDVYLESLGILASIPAGLLILSLFGLLLYLLTRCCDRKPRKPSAQRCQSCSLVIIALMTCASIGLGLYGNDDFHNGLLQAFSSGKQVEGLVFSLKRQTEAIKHDLEMKMAQHRLEAQIERAHYNQTAVMLLIETCNLVRENTSRAVTSLDNMVLYFMKTKGSENDTSLMGLLHLGELYESIRWPATLGFLTLLLLLCTVLVIGIARSSRCALIFFSVSGLFCIIMCWLLSGIYLASSVAAGDFCMRPHEYMCRQVGMRSPYVYFLNCGTLRNRFILRLNESRDLVERARESVYLIQRMSQETYPRIDVHKTLEAMDMDLEETKRNLTVLSATLDRRAIDRHYAEALRGLCGGGLLGLSLMMIAGLLTSFLFTILVYADSHAWIYLSKQRPSLDIDKSETAPLFPSNAPSANISPTAPLHHTGTINRTLLHHQQSHSGLSAGSTGTLGSARSNATTTTANGLRSGFASSHQQKHHYHHHHQHQSHAHKINTSLGSNTNTITALSSNSNSAGGAGASTIINRRLSPSPPPGYDVVVHGTRSGHHTLGRLPSHHQQSSSSYISGPNNGKYATLSKQSGSSLRSVLSSQTSNPVCRSAGNGLDQDDDKDPRDVSNNSFNRFDPKYISIGPKAVRANNNLNMVAAATGNKCATLRHVGRYGGSLKGASPSPNLRNAKVPSIATVSKEYCSQPECLTQPAPTYPSNNVEVITPQTQVNQPPPPPLPPPKPKNTFTEIPGTTGVGSSYAKEQLKLQLQQIQQQHQHHQQQQPYQMQGMQHTPIPNTVIQSMQQHPTTTHILPASAVYSIESSTLQKPPPQQFQREVPKVTLPPPLDPPIPLPLPPKAPSIAGRPLPLPVQSQPTTLQTPQSTHAMSNQQRSLNPNSIVNQPLPEIPTTAVQHQHQQQQQQIQPKISPQPLCAANLNPYRSLQRPQTQKLHIVATNGQSTLLQQHQQQTVNQLQPPSLPPKNRHKTSPRQQFNINNELQQQQMLQALPPKISSSWRHQQQQQQEQSYERERDRERDRDRHERPRRSETLDNSQSHIGGYRDNSYVRKQHSYDSAPQNSYHQQPRHASTTLNNNYHHMTASTTAKQHQQQQLLADAQQQMYYRSLKRGGSTQIQPHNDMYSVTEL